MKTIKQPICFPKHFAFVLFLVFVSLLLLIYVNEALAIPASSDSEPAEYTQSRGVTQVAYNIQDTNGTWTYDYIEIEGTITEAKVLEAMRAENLEADVGDWTPDEVATKLEDSRAAIGLANISDMTYAELDAYIQDNVTNLAEAKQYLKKLSKVVLAMLKQQNLE